MPNHKRPNAGWLLAACLAVLLCMPGIASGDTASWQLQEQQQNLRDLQQQQRLERWQGKREPSETSPGPATVPAHQPCWEIRGVQIAGNHQLPDTLLADTVRRSVTACMGPADIDGLLRALTGQYVAAGFPASRPYLAQTPRSGAPLRIGVVEGFVESIELAGPELPLSLSSAFPDMLGHPLYLPQLEQGLDQLNRLRAYDLGADLLPGTLPGATRVVVQPRKVASPWHLDNRFDNRGSDQTGRHRLTTGLGLDSPLGLNDDLRVSLSRTVFGAPGNSRGLTLYYSIPYGPWTIAMSASRLRYKAPLPGSHQVADGSSRYHSLSAERVLWRGPRGMLSASVRLDRKQLINRSASAVIVQQSPTLATLEAGVNLLWLEQGLWNAYLGVAQGIGAFGADRSPIGVQRLRPDFRKYRANLLHLRQGPAEWPWRWQSEVALQYSDDALPAVEQLLASDDTAVRGFRLRTYSGSSSAVWRNTVSLALPHAFNQALQIRPYLGVDLGWARTLPGSTPQRLAGAAAGVELSLPGSRLRLDYQRALHASDLPGRRLEPGFWVLDWALTI